MARSKLCLSCYKYLTRTNSNLHLLRLIQDSSILPIVLILLGQFELTFVWP